MKIHFFGATRTTTGSKHLLEINGKRILLECGLFQGRREESNRLNSELPFEAGSVDVMLLSHAHIDHSGLIPVLCREGFSGSIYCTEATADLCRIMLMDSAHIQEQDAAFVSKKHAKRGLPPVLPLYTAEDAEKALRQFRPVPYHSGIEVSEGVRATWLDAGHILGSAMIVLDCEEAGKRFRLVFSGDLGRGGNDILRDPELPENVDGLIVESTYGNREHESLEDVNKRVCDILNRSLESGGKIIIPSFAVGRTQQLLFTLYQLIQEGCITSLPIFVDSPLSVKATEVFRNHPECYNKSFYDVMMNGENPFHMDGLRYVTAVEDSIALNGHREPCIIISASGMAEAGRIRHHIKNNISDERNTILIVGWCAPHTLGSHLASGHKEVNIFGDPYQVKAHVETINAFSGHADRSELSRWAAALTGQLRKIYVVHGEESSAMAYAELLKTLHPSAKIAVPDLGFCDVI